MSETITARSQTSDDKVPHCLDSVCKAIRLSYIPVHTWSCVFDKNKLEDTQQPLKPQKIVDERCLCTKLMLCSSCSNEEGTS